MRQYTLNANDYQLGFSFQGYCLITHAMHAVLYLHRRLCFLGEINFFLVKNVNFMRCSTFTKILSYTQLLKLQWRVPKDFIDYNANFVG